MPTIIERFKILRDGRKAAGVKGKDLDLEATVMTAAEIARDEARTTAEQVVNNRFQNPPAEMTSFIQDTARITAISTVEEMTVNNGKENRFKRWIRDEINRLRPAGNFVTEDRVNEIIDERSANTPIPAALDEKMARQYAREEAVILDEKLKNSLGAGIPNQNLDTLVRPIVRDELNRLDWNMVKGIPTVSIDQSVYERIADGRAQNKVEALRQELEFRIASLEAESARRVNAPVLDEKTVRELIKEKYENDEIIYRWNKTAVRRSDAALAASGLAVLISILACGVATGLIDLNDRDRRYSAAINDLYAKSTAASDSLNVQSTQIAGAFFAQATESANDLATAAARLNQAGIALARTPEPPGYPAAPPVEYTPSPAPNLAPRQAAPTAESNTPVAPERKTQWPGSGAEAAAVFEHNPANAPLWELNPNGGWHRLEGPGGQMTVVYPNGYVIEGYRDNIPGDDPVCFVSTVPQVEQGGTVWPLTDTNQEKMLLAKMAVPVWTSDGKPHPCQILDTSVTVPGFNINQSPTQSGTQ